MITTPLPAGSLRATSLNAARRATELAEVAEAEIDMLVVGGGVTGAGAALDAAARGLSVAMVEAEDLAWGTSRWSSKLVHGGLRYLAHGDVALAHESAVERNVLMTRTAPHLVRTMPQLIPLHSTVSRRSELVLTAGLHAGDALRRAARTPSDVLPPPRRIPSAEALALVPGLRAAGLRGGLLGYDGQLIDDARLVVALARTAAGFGARVLTHVRAQKLDSNGADVVDQRTGETLRIRARSVVNAAGVWAGELSPDIKLRPSRGSHLVIDAEAAGIAGTALVAPIPGASGRFLLLLPQADGRALLGLTDEPAPGPIPSVPEVPESDVDFLLAGIRDVLGQPLGREHVLGSFAGLRPLLEQARRKESSDLSRKHAVLTSPEGVVTVVGGKLTTYRKMAAEAVDAAVLAGGLSAGPSKTAAVALVGAAPRRHLTDVEAPARLIAKYGTEAARIAALADFDPDLAEPVAEGVSLTAAEVLWAVRHEGALDADDVLDRRSRVGLNPAERDIAQPFVTELVGRALEGVLN
ncbi:glycerol-3-phosphate dehydrogenase [Saccharopolyspora antimicrobica]|uniref:Glycerol-3-phosphate dehydrogenase n=1 Tax=Saccharopolyspora antimicrobica TaxID=455193 RepID=A0A1I5F5I4_9PSEU|nr:glycerol-3-phosphate dehydrogenase/oxidase [Saccharopolyspora antimicrobica]RKT83686.1 glycerol-3-phosphate dehydrogenase [Saccharopolyspora antimicrobica]SFO18879.1 glycerol-3-phosphate dehydrogenase [Saccharopolyspora antimicrobica]